ncbi:sulfatase-like hydrolase/transferase [Pendulispora rubella]|uniref:Sulfatase-like hydrolase/transferase n=1 Tax=Pendulispora rubella TaxID=2741070 RepID=A0ABZ2LC59_9BACT
MSSWFGSTCLGVVLAASGLAVVHRYGTRAETALVPRIDAVAPSKVAPKPVAVGEAYQARTRFVSALGDARLDVPNAKMGLSMLKPHWRKMGVPFASLSDDARKLAMSIVLRTSAHEEAWSTKTPSGGNWMPNARVWNMNEGSFDQREGIFAPPPATVGYRVRIPPHAALSFSAAMVNRAVDDGVFTVTLVDAGGAEHELCSKRVSSAEASVWHDVTCPLEPWVGHDVELRFQTSSVPAPPERRPKAEKAPLNDDLGPVLATNLPLLVWGNPTLLAKELTNVPYNVVWIVVDALRPDVIPSFHDDAEDVKKLAAPYPPLDALLPKIDGLTPSLDALARAGTRFTNAHSAATWTRPGTLAMLAGARASEIGIESLHFVLHDSDIERYYSSEPPLISRILAKNGVLPRAFVNNFFMAGYATAGLDMGFERVADHRYHTRDTAEITHDTVSFIHDHASERFFLFCNYNSPHSPWEPPQKFLDRVPLPPAGPSDKHVRRYMAEAAKDDEAIGEVVRALDEAHLRERTLIVVTADHGETLSSAHDGVTSLDELPVRFHHAAGNYEETSRIPILAVLPGVIPANKAVTERVRSIDIAPTVLELQGLTPPTRMSGRSLVPLMGGAKEDERVVLTEGRATRGLMVGRYRLLAREGKAQTTRQGDKLVTASEELFDLEDDPGERHDIAPGRPDLVAEMRARLAAAEKNVAVAGAESVSRKEGKDGLVPLHLRFVGGGAVHRVSGTLQAAGVAAAFRVEPVGIAREVIKVEGPRVEFGFSTVPDGAVGFDLRVEPADAKLAWDLYLDDRAWPADRFFAGPLGLWEASLEHGITTDEARSAIVSSSLPVINFTRDLGLFVTYSGARNEGGGLVAAGASAEEMSRVLRAWGYTARTGGSGVRAK